MSALIAATENLILAARIAAHHLQMPLGAELGAAITRAQQAIEDERERLMKAEQKRQGIRDLAREVRNA